MPGAAFAPAADVLVATNRARKPGTGQIEFADVVLAQTRDAISFMKATITDMAPEKPDAGVIRRLSEPSAGAFSQDDLAPLLASQNDVLVFVHGADNTFEDAVKRAAYNKEWLGLGNEAGVSSVFDVIAFSWPARSYGALVLQDYEHDRTEASASASQFCMFLDQLRTIRARIGHRRMHLLCHSMGNYMLGSAVEAAFRSGAANPLPLFDRVVLAAADEDATTFSSPNGGRLANLRRMGREITVYFNRDDGLMHLSQTINPTRLGFDGPPNASDTAFFSRGVYAFVDCTGVYDAQTTEIFGSHQYYRNSPTVRADIIATLGGGQPKGRNYSPLTNKSYLFQRPSQV